MKISPILLVCIISCTISLTQIVGCTDSNASSTAKPSTPKSKVTTHKIRANGETYKNVKSYAVDSTGCITFHIPPVEGGCGCSGEPAKDIKVCGAYSIESVTE